MNSVAQIGAAIKKVLQDQANRAGVSTGFIQRVREFTGATFAQTMVLGQMQEGYIGMSDLSTFARHVGVNVSAQAIHKRFNSKTAAFFQELLSATCTQVVAADPVAIPLLERGSSVIVEDSTSTPAYLMNSRKFGRDVEMQQEDRRRHLRCKSVGIC